MKLIQTIRSAKAIFENAKLLLVLFDTVQFFFNRLDHYYDEKGTGRNIVAGPTSVPS